MPAKIKITDEQILKAALEILRKEGIDHLNARALCQKLDCTARPIFRAFGSMDGLKDALITAADKKYMEKLQQPYPSDYPFLNLGMNYIRFANEEKYLFEFLFMSSHIHVETPAELIGSGKLVFIREIADTLQLSEEKAAILFLEVCLLAHGIAVLNLTNSITFSDKEIERLLMLAFEGIFKHLQEEE